VRTAFSRHRRHAAGLIVDDRRRWWNKSGGRRQAAGGGEMTDRANSPAYQMLPRSARRVFAAIERAIGNGNSAT
jgi:hypothetical protein